MENVNSLLAHLTNPVVQEVIQEWHTLRTSGLIKIPPEGSEGATEMRRTLRDFLNALRDLANEHRMIQLLSDGPNMVKDIPEEMVTEGMQQAESMCLNEGFEEAIYALCLLRRRFRDGIKEETKMIDEIDSVIGLIVPDFLLRDVWYYPETEQQREAMWVTLGALMKALDCHCPEEVKSASP